MRDVLDPSLAVEANLKFNVRHTLRLITELSQHHVTYVSDQVFHEPLFYKIRF